VREKLPAQPAHATFRHNLIVTNLMESPPPDDEWEERLV
jgi:hypothetical protein